MIFEKLIGLILHLSFSVGGKITKELVMDFWNYSGWLFDSRRFLHSFRCCDGRTPAYHTVGVQWPAIIPPQKHSSCQITMVKDICQCCRPAGKCKCQPNQTKTQKHFVCPTGLKTREGIKNVRIFTLTGLCPEDLPCRKSEIASGHLFCLRHSFFASKAA